VTDRSLVTVGWPVDSRGARAADDSTAEPQAEQKVNGIA
jgi:hypothetical protein